LPGLPVSGRVSPGFRISLPRGLSLGGQPVLGALGLGVPGGRTTALLGPSGSGKSTLLRLVAGLLPVPAGGNLRAEDGAPIAGRVAYMAQQDLLAPWRDVLGNIAMGTHLRGERPDLPRARALLAEVGLTETDGAKMPAQLSGGMRQRVALARTLMEDRPLVLMDEPFSAVDAPTRHRMQSLSARLLAGRTVLLVTHDPLEALRLADHIFVLSGSPSVPVGVQVPKGPPPRPAGDPALLAAQAALLERLAEAVA
jgi:putative hydroxymethylpyrimidine transport system ATP-binding protein